LPVGIESEFEQLYLSITVSMELEKVIEKLNCELPEGLTILGVKRGPRKKEDSHAGFHQYQIVLRSGIFEKESLNRFINAKTVCVQKMNKKGVLKNIDLKDIVAEIEIDRPERLFLKLKAGNGKRFRPGEILHYIFGLEEKVIKCAEIIKLKPPEMGKQDV
jgi:radical SAM-linked protein